jgi:YtkA-like protein
VTLVRLFVCALIFAACDSGGSTRTSQHQTIMSDHSLFHVDVLPTPDPPIRGTDNVILSITDAAGAPVDGLQIDAQPWMPAHGHGTSVVPTLSAQGGGRYQLQNVYLYMAGTWELRLTFSGPESDTATPTFDIP